jgi:hypothetical protein
MILNPCAQGNRLDRHVTLCTHLQKLMDRRNPYSDQPGTAIHNAVFTNSFGGNATMENLAEKSDIE